MLHDESVFPVGELPRHVPACASGRKISKATSYRWAYRGVRGVKLETFMLGGTLCTSLEAAHRFFAAVTAARNAAVNNDGPGETAKARTRALQSAEAACVAAGI